MTIAQQITLCADKLRDNAANGLKYSKSKYEEERYKAIQDIAMEMQSIATNNSLKDLEPLRATVYSRPTPLTVDDAGVVDNEGRILLVQRADNHKWAMPGGFLEVGETPAEGVVRETLEETGVHCHAVALVGVFDSRHCGTISLHHLYHFVFLCRPTKLTVPRNASHAEEVIDVRWFEECCLPKDIDPSHVSRILEVFRVWHGNTKAFFDLSEQTNIC